jgi:hypothetical protein
VDRPESLPTLFKVTSLPRATMTSFWSRGSSSHEKLPETKRISTPAGQRLSIVLENGTAAERNARQAHRVSVRKSGLSAVLADVPRESMEEKSAYGVANASPNSSGYSFSVWSEVSALKYHEQVVKRGGWRKLAIILAVILTLVTALAVGLGIALKKKPTRYITIIIVTIKR